MKKKKISKKKIKKNNWICFDQQQELVFELKDPSIYKAQC
jgi:putative AlgH/UPF0301 family transcriptional regulator